MARRSLGNVLRLIEQANREIPVEEQFLEDLKRSIELTDKASARVPSTSYKPSSMNCIRSMYYTKLGIPQVRDSSYMLIGICEAGTDRHERIQNAIAGMKANGIDCEYLDVGDYVKEHNLPLEVVSKQGNETKLYDPVRDISFLCDGIIKYKKHYYIVEFKTESSSKWQERKGVDPKHYNQGRTYSLELGIDEVLFVYINRDFCSMKCYLYVVTDEERQLIDDLIRSCDSYLEKRSVPPADPENKKCAYCGYKDQCRKDGGNV